MFQSKTQCFAWSYVHKSGVPFWSILFNEMKRKPDRSDCYIVSYSLNLPKFPNSMFRKKAWVFDCYYVLKCFIWYVSTFINLQMSFKIHWRIKLVAHWLNLNLACLKRSHFQITKFLRGNVFTLTICRAIDRIFLFFSSLTPSTTRKKIKMKYGECGRVLWWKRRGPKFAVFRYVACVYFIFRCWWISARSWLCLCSPHPLVWFSLKMYLWFREI